MKKTLLLAIGLLLLGTTGAQVQWHSAIEASKAKIGNKMYFIDFYTDWCGYCKKMDRETFTDPTVALILNRYFYPVKFNAESTTPLTWAGRTFQGATGKRGSTHQFAANLRGFPSFVLYRADGSPIQVIPGFYSAKDFVVVLWYFASGDCDRYPFEQYSKMFDKEIRPTMLKQLNQQ